MGNLCKLCPVFPEKRRLPTQATAPTQAIHIDVEARSFGAARLPWLSILSEDEVRNAYGWEPDSIDFEASNLAPDSSTPGWSRR